MNSTLATYFLHLKTPSSFNLPSLHHSTTLKSHNSICTSSQNTISRRLLLKSQLQKHINANAQNPRQNSNFDWRRSFHCRQIPCMACESRNPAALTEQNPSLEEEQEEDDIEKHQNQNQSDPSTPLQAFLESNAEAIESLNSLLQQKLENGQDEEALKIVKLLVAAQPEVIEWKFLMARLLSEMGWAQDARNVFEAILVANPLSFEALFENALLMNRFGEGEAVTRRLQEALDIAEEENKVKEARDVRLIMAQIQFLQKNVEEALKSYQELSKEDPKDFRPYFCRGMIYSLLDRNEEAKQQFAKYRELSPKKLEVEGYLRTSLSRMKLFGSNEKN